MTVYLDLIFLENIFMNSIIIYATAIILKKEIKILRILARKFNRCNLCLCVLHIKLGNIFKHYIKIIAITCNSVHIISGVKM